MGVCVRVPNVDRCVRVCITIFCSPFTNEQRADNRTLFFPSIYLCSNVISSKILWLKRMNGGEHPFSHWWFCSVRDQFIEKCCLDFSGSDRYCMIFIHTPVLAMVLIYILFIFGKFFWVKMHREICIYWPTNRSASFVFVCHHSIHTDYEWDIILLWYSLNARRRICYYTLKVNTVHAVKLLWMYNKCQTHDTDTEIAELAIMAGCLRQSVSPLRKYAVQSICNMSSYRATTFIEIKVIK